MCIMTIVWLLIQSLPAIAEEFVQRFDTNGDGKIDQWEYYKSDTLTRVERDRDYNEHIDHWVIYQNGKIVQAEFDTNESGKADQREFYDSKGVLQRVTSDEDSDGQFEQQLFYGPDKQIERLERTPMAMVRLISGKLMKMVGDFVSPWIRTSTADLNNGNYFYLQGPLH